jgi:hypothetical protein
MWFNDVGIKKWFPIKLNTRNSEIGVKGMLFKVRSKDGQFLKISNIKNTFLPKTDFLILKNIKQLYYKTSIAEAGDIIKTLLTLIQIPNYNL